MVDLPAITEALHLHYLSWELQATVATECLNMTSMTEQQPTSRVPKVCTGVKGLSKITQVNFAKHQIHTDRDFYN